MLFNFAASLLLSVVVSLKEIAVAEEEGCELVVTVCF
jgi:hypothetical protein